MSINSLLTKIDSRMATLDNLVKKKKKYQECNTTLPDNVPYITKEECKKAFTLLTKKFGKKKIRHSYRDEWVKRKMPIQVYAKNPRRCWISLSGDSNTLSKGWRRLIHDVSHMVHRFLRPKLPNHCFQQAELELAMIKYVLDKGWLNGTLKPKVVILSKNEKRIKKIEGYKILIKKWQTKSKLANTFIKKYSKKIKYYERKEVK